MRLTGNVTGMDETIKHTEFWSETLKKKPLWKLKSKRKDNIKTDFKDAGVRMWTG
jgi:hypothetical protein